MIPTPVSPFLVLSPSSRSSGGGSRFSSPTSSPLTLSSLSGPKLFGEGAQSSPSPSENISPKLFNFSLKPLKTSLKNAFDSIVSQQKPALSKFELTNKLTETCKIRSYESYKDLFKDQEFNAADFYEIGETHLRGYDNHKKNIQEAFLYFRLSAEQGHPDAQFKLGLLYGNSRELQSIHWLKMAARNQHKAAQDMLKTLEYMDDLDETEKELDHLQISLESSRHALSQLIYAAKKGDENAQLLVDKFRDGTKSIK